MRSSHIVVTSEVATAPDSVRKKFCTPAAEATSLGLTLPSESAVSGTFHGKTEVMEYMGRLAERSLTVTLKRLIAEGDTVVAITDVTVDGQTGEDADVFTIRNGKTIRAEMHGDTSLMEKIYGKKQLAAG